MPLSEQGVSLDRYMLIPRVLIFITRGMSVLLLKGSPNKRIWANKYNGVGGHVEAGEDVLSAARRELWEETGLSSESVEDLRLVGTVMVETEQNPGIGMYIFTGEYRHGEPKASAEGMLEWIEMDRIGEYPAVEDVVVLVGRVRGLKKGDPPFSARSFYREDRLVMEFS